MTSTATTNGDGAGSTRKERIGASDLGIEVSRGTDSVLFRWLVACLLFGARISQERAAAAWRELNRARLLTPSRLAEAEPQRLVELLRAGGYSRFDDAKSHELVKLGTDVLERYGGRLSRLPKGADSEREVRRRLQEFTGIGPTATEIFLRDAGSVWTLPS